MQNDALFIDVLLPLPVPGCFTYRVKRDDEYRIGFGKRVVVQFGRKKIYTALVTAMHHQPPRDYAAKYIIDILDDRAIINDKQYHFWQWISDYYLCYRGEVMNAALPSALKLASETSIVLHPEFQGDYSGLSEKEHLLTEALEIQKEISVSDAARIIEQKTIIPVIRNLIDKKIALTNEEIRDTYKKRMESFISLDPQWQEEKKLSELFDELNRRAYRQLEVLMAFISLRDADGLVKQKNIFKKTGTSAASSLNALLKKGVLIKEKKEVSRLKEYSALKSPDDILITDHQRHAYESIIQLLQEKNTVLLHGVTSSGKTEIYIRLISEYIALGKQVLYLLPEIALTTQIINRLRRYFGDKVGVYHSRYSEYERVEIWQRVLDFNKSTANTSKYQIILGARSAVFLPFTELGLVIVDEEHDASFKQYEPAPRYNGRDTALYLAGLHGAKTVLGSATPSVESYFQARSGKYGLAELHQRYGSIEPPEILVDDLKDLSRMKLMKSLFSPRLIDTIKETLENKQQAILFQNRRGFAPRIQCEDCGWAPECKHCDVGLTYHKNIDLLKCHYCGYAMKPPDHCPSCKSKRLKMLGFGTEKIEDEIKTFFPHASVARMDQDTTRGKYAHQKILNDFEEGRTDILVGTQMISKGLDFGRLSLVGVLNADNMIHFPDFRSQERSFQMLLQVSGRAGRRDQQGKVIIQTYNPHHNLINFVKNNDYFSLYSMLLPERQKYKYPPFYRLVIIRLKHRDHKVLSREASRLAELLRPHFPQKLLGPEYPLVARIKNFYIKQILLKLERGSQVDKQKVKIKEIIEAFDKKAIKAGRVRISIDVDPS